MLDEPHKTSRRAAPRAATRRAKRRGRRRRGRRRRAQPAQAAIPGERVVPPPVHRGHAPLRAWDVRYLLPLAANLWGRLARDAGGHAVLAGAPDDEEPADAVGGLGDRVSRLRAMAARRSRPRRATRSGSPSSSAARRGHAPGSIPASARRTRSRAATIAARPRVADGARARVLRSFGRGRGANACALRSTRVTPRCAPTGCSRTSRADGRASRPARALTTPLPAVFGSRGDSALICGAARGSPRRRGCPRQGARRGNSLRSNHRQGGGRRRIAARDEMAKPGAGGGAADWRRHRRGAPRSRLRPLGNLLSSRRRRATPDSGVKPQKPPYSRTREV